MLLLCTSINISDLESLRYLNARLKHAANDTVHQRIDRLSACKCNNLSFAYKISDHSLRFDHSICRCFDQTLNRISSDISRNSGIRDRTSVPYYISQCMSSLCLDHAIAVFSCSKTRADSDHKRCICDLCSEISLCKDSIHDYIRLKPLYTFCLWINDHRDISLFHNLLCFFLILCQACCHIFYNRLTFINRSGKCNQSADCQRHSNICHHDLVSCTI